VFVCECGKSVITAVGKVKRGTTGSCGCLAKQILADRSTTHGLTRSKEGMKTIQAWNAMWQRCTNEAAENYRNYGGRGITVCDRWKTFDAFYADMGIAPEGYSLDRINCNGNYEPGNCRWATNQQQAENRRTTVNIECDGAVNTMSAWAKQNGIPLSTVFNRLKQGWEPGKAVSQPSRRMVK
jgi:hypothetical protein